VQAFRDHPVPRTVSAAATAVREEDNTRRMGRHNQVAVQDPSDGRYLNRGLKITTHESSVPPIVRTQLPAFAAGYGCGEPAGEHGATARGYAGVW
jgi:hypothetical protein